MVIQLEYTQSYMYTNHVNLLYDPATELYKIPLSAHYKTIYASTTGILNSGVKPLKY